MCTVKMDDRTRLRLPSRSSLSPGSFFFFLHITKRINLSHLSSTPFVVCSLSTMECTAHFSCLFTIHGDMRNSTTEGDVERFFLLFFLFTIWFNVCFPTSSTWPRRGQREKERGGRKGQNTREQRTHSSLRVLRNEMFFDPVFRLLLIRCPEIRHCGASFFLAYP